MPATPPHDSGRSASRDPGRSRQGSRQSVAFALAFLLPILSSAITARVHFLHLVPFALHFISMALIAMLGGLLPALTAVLISVLSHNYYVDKIHLHWILAWSDGLRSIVLLISAVLISLMNRRRQQASDKLEALLYALQERTDALVQSLHNSRCASWTLDLAHDRAIHWYSGSYQIFGQPFAPNQSLESFRLLLYPDDQPKLTAVLDQMRLSSDPVVFEFRVPWPDGEMHWLECRGTRTPGHACLWRGVTVDVTDRKLGEAALLRAEKLAAMGRLASTIAHEINNPLEAAINLLYLARTDDTLTGTTSTWLETAERELARLGNITRLTLGFVRTNSSGANIGVVETVEDVLSIFRHRYEMRDIQIERDYQPSVTINIPPHELRQIATNLISNAIDAISGPGSRVCIRVHREGDRAVLLFEDNGIGIPAAQLSRIFEAFYSTKVDVGTGIGLWVTKELTEKNGGCIAVQSGDLPSGMRTSFRVEFPAAAPAALPTPTQVH
ncbi:MAG TPA: ATP-binding protein [Granulicella sp.]|nr:ATP-binding protein [Granulicella sp.]